MIDFVPSAAVLWFDCRHEFDGEAIGVGCSSAIFERALDLPFFLVARDNPTECSGPPHLLGPWGSVGRSAV